MKVKDILKLLQKKEFSKICNKYNVNHKSKKLPAEHFLLLIFYTIFSERFCSLRKLQENYNDPGIQKQLFGSVKEKKIDHTSFHYRLTKIDYRLFQDFYEKTLKEYKNTISQTKSRYELKRFDTTIVSLSSKLLKAVGYKMGRSKKGKTHIKYTVGYTDIPEVLKMHSSKSYASDNTALGESMVESDHESNSILLFDRGMNKRSVMDEIAQKHSFVSRLQKGYRLKEESSKKQKTKEEVEKGELEVTKELKGHLYNKKNKLSEKVYRIIHAQKKEEVWDGKKANKVNNKKYRKKHEGISVKSLEEQELKEELIIVTNLPEEEYSTQEVLNIYKRRWDIEVFFKFIKQELDFSHFVNRSENGIKVMFYIRMLFALLLLIYKKKNKLEGYKYVKSGMMKELDLEYLRYVIEESGGSYDKYMSSRGRFWWGEKES